MTGPDRTSDSTGPVDPWAPGGEMASVAPSSSSAARLTFNEAETPSQPPPYSNRRWLLGGVALLVAGVVAAVALSGGDDETTEPASTDDRSIPLTTSLPNVPAITRATLPEPTMPRPTPPPLLADRPPPEPTPAQQLALIQEPREFVVDVAPELDDINPTEVVALGENELFEVSLPSGRVRATRIGFDTVRSTTRVATNDAGAVVWPRPGGGVLIIGAAGSAAVLTETVTIVSWSPGSNQMYLWGLPSRSTAPTVRRVDLSNRTIETAQAPWIDGTEDPVPFVDSNGAMLRNDAGGTYRLAPDGTTRITTGDVVASGANHVLVRECDAARTCSLVSIDGEDGRTPWSVDLPVTFMPQEIGGLSPGGDALLMYSNRIAPDAARSLWVLELTDGTVQSVRRQPAAEVVGAWDTSGAGFFVADPALLYVDRFTGASVAVSDDLTKLRGITARRPQATPICEVLAIALPRFDLMRVGGTANTVSPPPTDVLDRIVALAPATLEAQATALVTFVAGFVSADVADSQTVANWPADVLNGLDALDSYAAAECPLIRV